MNETTVKLDNTRNKVDRDESGKILPGQESLNPKGRPKGSFSIKDTIRKHLQDNPEDFKQFFMHFVKDNKELAWQMMEGRPQQDVTSDGEPLQIVFHKAFENELSGSTPKTGGSGKQQGEI